MLKIYAIFAAVLITLGIAHWADITLRESAWEQKYAAQAVSLTKACGDAQAITKGQNDELIKSRDRIRDDLARAKRMYANTCVYSTATGKLPAGGDQHAKMLGISAEWGSEFAALCETYRSELMVCAGQTDTE